MADDIAREIQECLERTGLSYRRAGEILDVDHNTLHRWAHGVQRPQHPQLVRLALVELERRHHTKEAS